MASMSCSKKKGVVRFRGADYADYPACGEITTSVLDVSSLLVEADTSSLLVVDDTSLLLVVEDSSSSLLLSASSDSLLRYEEGLNPLFGSPPLRGDSMVLPESATPNSLVRDQEHPDSFYLSSHASFDAYGYLTPDATSHSLSTAQSSDPFYLSFHASFDAYGY